MISHDCMCNYRIITEISYEFYDFEDSVPRLHKVIIPLFLFAVSGGIDSCFDDIEYRDYSLTYLHSAILFRAHVLVRASGVLMLQHVSQGCVVRCSRRCTQVPAVAGVKESGRYNIVATSWERMAEGGWRRRRP